VAQFLTKTQHKVGLEELFGMDRHRFGKGLRRIDEGREAWYDYRAVVQIMHRLLNEEPLESKGSRLGKTRRLWLGNRNEGIRGRSGIVARRVITGIISRMERLSVSGEIWDAFTAFVSLHIVKGIGERLPKDLKDQLTALVHRHLDLFGKMNG
jgi:hypothetical protein